MFSHKFSIKSQDMRNYQPFICILQYIFLKKYFNIYGKTMLSTHSCLSLGLYFKFIQVL